LGVKNPDKEEKYKSESTDVQRENLRTEYFRLFGIPETTEDVEFMNQMINFYKEIADNIAYNIYEEMRFLLDNLKKRSILIKILKLLKEKTT